VIDLEQIVSASQQREAWM